MTFSIVGYCEQTGMIGVVIATSSISVGSRCPWVRTGSGGVVTQNITDPTIGIDLLDLMESGITVSKAMHIVMNNRPNASYRQVAAIDRAGNTAHYTGSNVLGINDVQQAHNCIAAGNLLKNRKIPEKMVGKFVGLAGEELCERLIAAIVAGVLSGGEVGPVHSAALLVTSEHPWPIVDLRVDWSEQPIDDLVELWTLYKPQMYDYVTRAIDPSIAPSYGVEGNK